MLEVETKMLRASYAGGYEPSLLGKVKSLIYNDRTLTLEDIIQQEVMLVDISFYQRFANFDTMKKAGVSGAIFRAGQNTWEDSAVQDYMEDAESNDLPFGTYWFYDSRVSPQAQAKKWKEVLGNHKTQLMCWADYEENYGGQYKGWKNLYDFLEACKIEMPDRKFGIYTGYYYWLDNSPIIGASLNYFAQYPLWMAWYTVDSSQVRIPRPWDRLTIWQNTAKGDGTKLGVGSLNIDMDVFNGTEEYFNEFFGITQSGIGGDMPDITFTGAVKSTVTSLVVRDTPNGIDTGQRIHANDAIQGVGVLVDSGNYKWMNIVSPVVGWVAETYLTYAPVSPIPPVETHVVKVLIDGVEVFSKEF